MRVLVLGDKGMLGSVVSNHLRFFGDVVDNITVRWPSREFKEFVSKYDGDFIINCIGSIPQKNNSFDINWEIPIFLDSNSKCNIIYPGTDCNNLENEYGRSKKIASEYILNNSIRTKMIVSSIIGVEIESSFSLMSWFLSNSDNRTVQGFTNQMWNGNTTLTWSKFCKYLMNNWNKLSKKTIIHSECISKYDLLSTINKVFDRKIEIEPVESVNYINRCLSGGIKTPHIEFQLEEFKNFMLNKC